MLDQEENTRFISLGISHWKSPLKIREKFSFSSERLDWMHKEAKAQGVSSFFVIDTCNRTQVFARFHDIEFLKEIFIKGTETCPTLFNHYGFVHEGKRAVDHLFALCMGLDSMILGDLQIINQVKTGIKYSTAYQLVDNVTHRLMQYVLQCYKSVSTDTDISNGPASIAHAAVLYIKQRFNNLEDKKILLYGLGEMGDTAVKNLIENYRVGEVTLMNRTFEKAEKLAKELNVLACPVECLKEKLQSSDIIIVATGADTYTVKESHFDEVDTHQRVILDLAVPRNVDIALENHPTVDLVEMDELQKIQDQTLDLRRKNIPKVKTIINLHEMEFYDWMKMREIFPLIGNFRKKMENLRTSELEKQKFKFTENELEKADVFSKFVMNKVMNQTIEYIKNRYRKNDDIIEIVNEMFQLKDPNKIQ
ncbi:MAG: glutamyl-tRNA reductase [Flavobacteriales bacterium]|jgi:glutamyl-tRNA reductase|nr:glutamyl-tRNA reductase [Flavobacteriales bacterium]